MMGTPASCWSRQLRLAHGWDTAELVWRMKFVAGRDGVHLPKMPTMLTWVFLWENQREPLTGFYAELMLAVFDYYQPRQRGNNMVAV
jgi:hypothetical protein